MALSQKTIVVTPRTGVGSPVNADPSIRFDAATGSPDGIQRITLYARPINNGTLSFEGSNGQLFSITNDFTGTIFSVNDVSGVPSIEVDADGTIALAEFGGNVGIGTGSPSEQLHILGRDVASSNTGIRVNSRGDAYLQLYADTASDTELENAYVLMSQDAGAVVTVMGTLGGANVDSQNNTFTGSTGNGFGIHHKFATGTIELGVNASVGLRIDDSNNVTIIGDLTSGTTYQDILASTAGANGLRFMNSVGTQQGYVYSDGSQTFGLLNSAGSWAVQIAPASTTVTFPGTINTNGNITGDGATAVSNMASYNGYGLNATASAPPGNSQIVKTHTNGYTYLGWINTTSGATTNVPDRIYTNQGGGDAFIRYQTVANFNTNVTSSASVGGDCTGTVGNIAVTNDSHTHTFANLTSKESGTGIYRTTTNFQATNGLIGTYDDAASSSWGGPIWGMDDGFTGPTGGANALPTSCYGMRWNRASSTQAHAAIGEGLYVYQNGVLEAGMGTAGVYSAAIMRAAGSIYPGGQTVGLIKAVTGNYGSVEVSGADGSSGSYAGISVDGKLVLMTSGTTGGIYDDTNNTWKIRMDQTGAGVNLYYGSVEEFTTLNSDAAGNTSGAQTKDHSQNYRDVGFNDLRLVNDNPASVAVVEENMGGVIYADDNTGFTITLPSSTSSFPVGGVITIINANTSVALTVADQASYTCFYLDGSTRTDIAGTATIAAGGVATIWRQVTGGTAAERTFLMWGSGITP